MISTKKHFEEYKGFFEENAVKTFEGLEDAANHFAKNHNVSTNEARERIENDTNADWIVCPNGKVYVMYLPPQE